MMKSGQPISSIDHRRTIDASRHSGRSPQRQMQSIHFAARNLNDLIPLPKFKTESVRQPASKKIRRRIAAETASKHPPAAPAEADVESGDGADGGAL